MIIPPLRGTDKYGSGAFGAGRGKRVHKGVDIACYAGSKVLSMTAGTVTKIGYPYAPSSPGRGHMRYVQVTAPNGDRLRYFYVDPSVQVYDVVTPGTELGKTQGLSKLYPGITDHYHFEIITPDGEYIDPTVLISGRV